MPKTQQCCGTPNIAEGERKIYREMAAHNIDLFSGKNVDVIVTDCAACGSELKTYRQTLSHRKAVARQAEEFSAKSKDISEFLGTSSGAGSRARADWRNHLFP